MKLLHWVPVWGLKKAFGSEGKIKKEWLYFGGLGFWNGFLLFGVVFLISYLVR
jgi:hypothetical protein